MDFVDLRLFLNVVHARSLTRGADMSALSLPAASMRIKKLEEDFGTPLLRRDKRGTTPLPAGEALAVRARLMLQELDALGFEMRRFAVGSSGHIRLLANSTAISDFLPKVLSGFLATHARVDIDLQERPSAEIVNLLLSRTADIGIVSGHVSPKGLETLPYYVDHLVLVVPQDHPLAGFQSVCFLQALEYDFVGRNIGSALAAFMNDVVTQYDRKLKLRIQVGSFEEMARLIEAGIGIGVMPISAVQRQMSTGALRVLPITDDWSVQHLKICFLGRSDLSEVANELIDHLAADAASLAPGPVALFDVR